MLLQLFTSALATALALAPTPSPTSDIRLLTSYIQPATQPATADPAQPLVIIQTGTMPLLISAPHGGRFDIPGVDKRTGQNVARKRGAKNNFVTGMDANVDKLALQLADEIERRTGKRPYLVVANFSRRNIDANRAPEDAYESSVAKPYYDQYHNALRDFRSQILATWHAGLLVDLHGHSRDPALIIRGTADWNSVRHLVEEYGKEALTGPNGLLAPLEAAGNKIEPPNADNDAKEYQPLNGGYITRHYGSFAGSNFDAIQFELGGAYRNPDRIPAFSKELTDALLPFLDRYIYPASEPQDDTKAHPTTRPEATPTR